VLATKQKFWKDYYGQLQADADTWLDSSNECTHLQTISLALEAAGQIERRRCLELGCGRGQMSRCLSVLDASERVAVDQVDSMLAGYAEDFPDVSWQCLDGSDQEAVHSLGKFDLIFALEVLQYLPISQTLPFLAERLTPGGRFVGVVPNAECPLVQNAVERFSGKYAAASVSEIQSAFETSSTIAWWSCRGLTFAEDQKISPYEVSPWTEDPQWRQPPNRILFVAQSIDLELSCPQGYSERACTP